MSRARRWALALRPEHHPRSDQSGHVEQPACGTRCPKEPHAQRSWHLQRSPPAQSEDLPPEVWLAESLRRRVARPRARNAPRSLFGANMLLIAATAPAATSRQRRCHWMLRGSRAATAAASNGSGVALERFGSMTATNLVAGAMGSCSSMLYLVRG